MACELRFTALDGLTHATKLELPGGPIAMRGGGKLGDGRYFERKSCKMGLGWLQASFCYRF